MSTTITVPDGYYDATVELDTEPIEAVITGPDGNVTSVKLYVTGNTYLIRWVYAEDYERLTSRKLEDLV